MLLTQSRDHHPPARGDRAPVIHNHTSPRAQREDAMVSQPQLDANRLNAARSTGPTTPAGKARVAHNAATHNAFCRSLVLPNEDKQRFLALRRAMLASLNPQDVAELFLAD